MYFPLAQEPTDNPTLSLAVRATGDARKLQSAIEQDVKTLVPSWPAFQFRRLDEGLELQRQLPRLAATLLGTLGGFGLFLAMIGVYGLMAYLVKQRRHEIGIHLALGAPARSVLALVIRQGMTVCLSGAAIGFGITLAAARLFTSLLYGISGADPLTYMAVPAVLLSVALLACYLPARQPPRCILSKRFEPSREPPSVERPLVQHVSCLGAPVPAASTALGGRPALGKITNRTSPVHVTRNNGRNAARLRRVRSHGLLPPSVQPAADATGAAAGRIRLRRLSRSQRHQSTRT